MTCGRSGFEISSHQNPLDFQTFCAPELLRAEEGENWTHHKLLEIAPELNLDQRINPAASNPGPYCFVFVTGQAIGIKGRHFEKASFSTAD